MDSWESSACYPQLSDPEAALMLPAHRRASGTVGAQHHLGVDRFDALAQLEMELRRGDVAGAADAGDHLSALDLIAVFHQQRFVVRISRHPTTGMEDQEQVAEAAELVAGIDHDTALCGMHRRAAWCL